MPGADRDVRLRVGVEKDGDTEVFKETADDLLRLEQISPEVQAQISQLLTELGSGSEVAGAKLAKLTAELQFTKEIQRAAELEAKFRQLTATIRTETDRTKLDKLEQEAQEVGQEMLEAGNKASRALREIRTESDRAGQSLSGVADVGRRLNGVLAAAGFAVGAQEVVQFARGAAQAALELEAYRVQLQAAAQDQELGNQLFEFAREQSTRLGLDLGGLVQQTASWIAATRESNLTTSQKVEILLRLVEAGRVAGRSEEELGRAIVAVTQIAAKGRLSLEELTGQLAEALPGAVGALARSLGVSTEALLEMIEKGELLADDALPALARGMEVTGEQIETSMETGRASVERLQVQFSRLKSELGEGLIEGIKLVGVEGDRTFSDLEDAAGNAGTAIGAIATFYVRQLIEAMRALEIINAFNTRGLAGVRDELKSLSVATGQQTDATDLLMRSQESAEESARRLAAAEAKLRAEVAAAKDEIFGSRVELEKQSRATIAAIQEVVRAGNLTTTQTELIMQAVQELLDAFEALGEDAPESLVALAKQFGVTSKAAEDHAKRSATAAKAAAAAQKKADEERVKSLKGVENALRDLLELQSDSSSGPAAGPPPDLKDAQDELKDLEGRPVNTLEEVARIDELKDAVRELEGQYGSAGQAAQAWGQDSAIASNKIDEVLRGLVESLDSELQHLSAGQETAIQQILQNLQAAAAQGVATSDVIAQAVGQIASIVDSTSGSFGGFRDLLDEAAGRGYDVGRALQEASARADQLAAAAPAAGAAVQQAGTAVAEGSAAAAAGSVSLERVGDQWRIVGEAAGEGAVSIRRAGEETEATSLRVQKSGEAAQAAGAAYSSLGTAAAGSSQGSDEAAQAALRAAGATGELKADIDTATISISRHRDEVTQAAAAEDQVGAAATAAGTAIASQAASTDSAAGATENLAGAADSATGAQGSLAGATGEAAAAQGELASAADSVATATQREVEAADRLKAALEGVAAVDLSPVFAQLQQLSVELEAVAAKAEEVGARINAALAVDDSEPEVEPIRSIKPN